jgi:hypothetical protein
VFLDWDLVEPGYGVAWAHARAEQDGLPRADKMPYGVTLSVHPPHIDLRPLVAADRAWESLINVYCTLFEDEGRFRLYYECHYQDLTDYTHDLKAMLAYAESRDGVTWEKPELGLLEFQGSTRNNLVYGLSRARGRGAHGATVFKDPSAPPAQRYKLVHMGREADRTPCVYGAVSPDGLASIEARTAGGFSTLPFSFSGRTLQLNAWTRFGGIVAVEVTGPDGTPLPGLTFAECDRLSGDLPAATVTWQGRSDLGELAGQPIRLNIRMERARLHAVQFHA